MSAAAAPLEQAGEKEPLRKTVEKPRREYASVPLASLSLRANISHEGA